MRNTFEGEFEVCIDANESHVALLTTTGEVQVFEDSPGKGLILTQTYTTTTATSSSEKASSLLYIYRNWLCVKKESTLHIWDLKTGIQLSKLRGLSNILRFRINGQLLVTRCLIKEDLNGLPLDTIRYIGQINTRAGPLHPFLYLRFWTQCSTERAQ